MQDARETVRGAKLYFCSQTEIQERYKVTMSQIYLEMNHIKKTFGELEVLKDISLSVHKGEVVSVIGPSGSGKSTLLRCATMLEKMDGGELSFLGEKAAWEENGKCVYANKKQLKEIRKNFGLVFQNFNLFPHYTVMKNIIDAPVCVDDVSKEEAKERAWKLLKQLGLSDKADAYPYQLSGGQQQRVSIARALALQPKVLFFDEPTSALDPELVGEVLDVIKKVAAQGYTMLLVSHEMNFIRHVSNRVIFLDKGHVVEDGTPKEVFDHPTNPRTQEFFRKMNIMAQPEYMI